MGWTMSLSKKIGEGSLLPRIPEEDEISDEGEEALEEEAAEAPDVKPD